MPWPAFLRHLQPPSALTTGGLDSHEENGLLLRGMQLVFSPHLPQAGAFYVVLQSGVVGVPHPDLWASYEAVVRPPAPAIEPVHHGLHDRSSAPQGQLWAGGSAPRHALQEIQLQITNGSRGTAMPDAAAAKRLRVTEDGNEENQGHDEAVRVATGVFA